MTKLTNIFVLPIEKLKKTKVNKNKMIKIRLLDNTIS